MNRSRFRHSETRSKKGTPRGYTWGGGVVVGVGVGVDFGVGAGAGAGASVGVWNVDSRRDK